MSMKDQRLVSYSPTRSAIDGIDNLREEISQIIHSVESRYLSSPQVRVPLSEVNTPFCKGDGSKSHRVFDGNQLHVAGLRASLSEANRANSKLKEENTRLQSEINSMRRRSELNKEMKMMYSTQSKVARDQAKEIQSLKAELKSAAEERQRMVEEIGALTRIIKIKHLN